MRYKFIKMQACGNDYVYIDCRGRGELETLAVGDAKNLADRHFGIGGDGVILICSSRVADCRMRIFNADGGEAKMCGNGLRCVAKLVGGNSVRIETLVGIKTVQKIGGADGGDLFRVSMGVVSVDGDTVNVGNLHKVFFVDNVDNLAVAEMVAGFNEYNVEFAEVVGEDTIKMRVVERGSGETLACGTGATAVAVVSVLRGLVNGRQAIKIKLRGGELRVDLQTSSGNTEAFLTGGATVVFVGEIECPK
jgi:diaminopimelate epimerase